MLLLVQLNNNFDTLTWCSGQAGATGKDGITTVKTVVDTINNSGWKQMLKANGGNLMSDSTATVVKPGDQINFALVKT